MRSSESIALVMQKFFYVASLFLLLISCSPKQSPSQGSHKSPYNGELVHLLNQFYSPAANANLSKNCDVKLKEQKYELAKALDKRNSEIQKIKSQIHDSNKEKAFLNFGNYKFEVIKIENFEDQWQHESNNTWKATLEKFKKIKYQPTNSDWLELDKDVRSLVTNDENRILIWDHTNFTVEEEPLLKEISEKVGRCNSDPKCSSLDLKKEEWDWIYSKDFYNSYYRFDTIHESDKKEVINLFSLRLRRDYVSNFLNVRRFHDVDYSKNQILVRIDGSIFGDDSQALFNEIENFWSQSEIKVKILDTSAPSRDFYKFVISPTQNRAFTNYTSKIISVSNYSRLKTIYHEFGHVLGFRDRYFTHWDYRDCSYNDHYNSADIMSDSKNGRILDFHRNTLKQLYLKHP